MESLLESDYSSDGNQPVGITGVGWLGRDVWECLLLSFLLLSLLLGTLKTYTHVFHDHDLR